MNCGRESAPKAASTPGESRTAILKARAKHVNLRYGMRLSFDRLLRDPQSSSWPTTQSSGDRALGRDQAREGAGNGRGLGRAARREEANIVSSPSSG
jgi:hypothetical protein